MFRFILMVLALGHAVAFTGRPIVVVGRRRVGTPSSLRMDVDAQDTIYSAPPPRCLGTLSLVGAGPGDPDLLTVKAVRVLAQADLVVADRLVSKEVLDLVSCEMRIANKNPGCAEESQAEIYRWVKEGVEAGKRVVRLKIGDPFVFGRGGEELLEARGWGVECEVVPGISSVFSAPLLAGIPVTHRGVANQVFLGTGYALNSGFADIADYHPQQTAVFLMAVGRLKELCADLKLRGYPGDTPIAIIERASTPNQRVVAGKVDTIVEIANEVKVVAPATIVVGEVVAVLNGRIEGVVADRMKTFVDDHTGQFLAPDLAQRRKALSTGRTQGELVSAQ